MSTNRMTLGQRVAYFASDVSVIGLNVIFNRNAHFVRRLAWFLLVLVGAAFMAYIIIDRVRFYLSNPTSVRFEVVFPRQLEFPAITLCNNNMLRRTWLHENGMYENVTRFVSLRNNHNVMKMMDPTHETPHMLDPLTPDLALAAAHQKEQLVMWAFFSNSLYNRSQFKEVVTDAGPCYTFNQGDGKGGGRLHATSSGVVSGITLILNTQQDEYLYEDVGRFSTAGFMLLLHAPDDVPVIFAKHIKTAPGTVTDVSMRLTKLSFLPPPYGSCGEKQLKYHRGEYRTSACQHECLSDHVGKTCGCRLANLVGPKDICSDLADIVCALQTSLQFHMSPEHQGACDCPHECKSTTYDASVSAAPFSNTYIDMLVKENDWGNMGISNVSEKYIRENIAQIFIYFASKSYETYEQQPTYSGWAMMSDIGGALGLFLGAAILTFAELLDFLFVTCLDYIKIYHNKYQSQQRQASREDGNESVGRFYSPSSLNLVSPPTSPLSHHSRLSNGTAHTHITTPIWDSQPNERGSTYSVRGGQQSDPLIGRNTRQVDSTPTIPSAKYSPAVKKLNSPSRHVESRKVGRGASGPSEGEEEIQYMTVV